MISSGLLVVFFVITLLFLSTYKHSIVQAQAKYHKLSKVTNHSIVTIKPSLNQDDVLFVYYTSDNTYIVFDSRSNAGFFYF